MIKPTCPYKFYELPEEKRISLIGQPLEYIITHKKKDILHGIFIPVSLSNKWENYGVAQGLLYSPEIHRMTYGEFRGENWSKIGVISPDDLDMDLDLRKEECMLRQDILRFISKNADMDCLYEEYFMLIKEEFGLTQDIGY